MKPKYDLHSYIIGVLITLLAILIMTLLQLLLPNLNLKVMVISFAFITSVFMLVLMWEYARWSI